MISTTGIASLGEVAVLAIVLPVVGLIAIKLFKLQNDLLYLKGNRIKILNEIVGGIKVDYDFLYLDGNIIKILNEINDGTKGIYRPSVFERKHNQNFE